MGKKLTTKDYDTVILHEAYGMSFAEIEKETGISDTSISVITRCLRTVKNKEWEVLKVLILNSAVSIQMLEWAQEKTSNIIPKYVYEAFYEKNPKLKPKPVEEAQAQITLEDVKGDDAAKTMNETKFFETVLKQQQQQNAIQTTIGRVLAGIANSLTSTLNNVKYIKENNDRNTTLICDKLKQINDRLDSIEKFLQ